MIIFFSDCGVCINHLWAPFHKNLKGNFSIGIEGALASTSNDDFNWKQLSEMILCIFLLMFSKFILVLNIDSETAEI